MVSTLHRSNTHFLYIRHSIIRIFLLPLLGKGKKRVDRNGRSTCPLWSYPPRLELSRKNLVGSGTIVFTRKKTHCTCEMHSNFTREPSRAILDARTEFNWSFLCIFSVQILECNYLFCRKNKLYHIQCSNLARKNFIEKTDKSKFQW